MPFHGMAIGGLSVGEPKGVLPRAGIHRASITDGETALSDGRRYAGGFGIRRVWGIDMFDCVMPTRNARNGWLFTLWRH